MFSAGRSVYGHRFQMATRWLRICDRIDVKDRVAAKSRGKDSKGSFFHRPVTWRSLQVGGIAGQVKRVGFIAYFPRLELSEVVIKFLAHLRMIHHDGDVVFGQPGGWSNP